MKERVFKEERGEWREEREMSFFVFVALGLLLSPYLQRYSLSPLPSPLFSLRPSPLSSFLSPLNS
jgi:hypothetical protein